MNREVFYKQVRTQLFAGRLAQGQVDGMESILNEWEARALTDSRYLAYMLATAFHETAFTMQPIEEYGKGRKHSYGLPDKLTGKTYFGRGFVQLTWKRNYESMGDILKVDLVNNPEQALDLKTATQVLFEGMLRGTFTPPRYYKLADFFTQHSDWYNARKIINGLDRAEQIAGYGRRFYFALLEAVGEIQKVQDVSKDLTLTNPTMENNLVEVKELAREFAPSANTANDGA
jgi:hypothetical protein